jgi:hypothetical protein
VGELPAARWAPNSGTLVILISKWSEIHAERTHCSPERYHLRTKDKQQPHEVQSAGLRNVRKASSSKDAQVCQFVQKSDRAELSPPVRR